MRTDYNKLKQKLQLVYYGKMEKIPKGKSIDTAIEIFKDVKKYEKYYDGDGNKDYEKELSEAKHDLRIIFGIDSFGLTRNKIYLAHQSAWVNSIYTMLNNGEL